MGIWPICVVSYLAFKFILVATSWRFFLLCWLRTSPITNLWAYLSDFHLICFSHVCLSGVTSYFDSQGVVKDFFDIRKSILGVLTSLGMIASLPKLVQAGPPKALSVLLDGRVIGSLPSSEIEKVVAHLRRLKVSATSAVCFYWIFLLVFTQDFFLYSHLQEKILQIPDDMEVGYVPLSIGGAYPGLYISTYPSRFIRPVRNISIPCEESQDIELIGPFEQVSTEFSFLSD